MEVLLNHDQSENNSAARPISFTERIELIDIIRGFALIGVLIINMQAFNMPPHGYISQYEPHSLLDNIFIPFIKIFVEAKFYSLFSLLFGLGFALILTRLKNRGENFRKIFLRRLAVLFGFGIFHALIIWNGDILWLYAYAGFFLYLFHKKEPRKLLKWAIILLTIFYVAGTAAIGAKTAIDFYRDDSKAALESKQEEDKEEAKTEAAFAVYKNGNYTEATVQRLKDLFTPQQISVLLVGLIYILPMFLIGAYIGHKRWLHNPHENRFVFQKMFMGGVIIGLVFGTAYVILRLIALPDEDSPLRGILALLTLYTAIPFCLAYLAGLVLLYQRPAMKKILHPLSYLGRMALTNYLTQSIVFTIVFFGYGFGQAGSSSVALMFAIAIPFIPIQIIFSRWWFNRFRFGPAEWLWRSLTYGRIQPFRNRPEEKILPDLKSAPEKVR